MKPLRLLILGAAIGVLAVDGAGAQPMQITPPVARPKATSLRVSTGSPQWAHWSSAGISPSSRRHASSNLRTLRGRNPASPRCRKVIVAASNSLGCGFPRTS